MRLISWNCQGAFRKKAGFILAQRPDILVVQECECIEKLLFQSPAQKPTDSYWYGSNLHKGVGIFSYSAFKFELLPVFNPAFRYILPLRVTGNGQTFILLAIWAMDDKENRKASYVGQIWRAIHFYAELLNETTVLVGDFNSNTIWDRKDREGNHTDLVLRLAEKNIHSVYHTHLRQEQGKEAHPTFFLQRNKKKPYHLDYCFTSKDWCDKLQQVSVGNFRRWIKHSDHLPLVIDFNL
jgi:exodeoxyribonuclease-3